LEFGEEFVEFVLGRIDDAKVPVAGGLAD